ncbi:hypothetical protein LTR36_008528 [Oleoguttula mirabilis]|uniref:Diaminopimelate epimerase-like protein n=1 Tax=Oleoguttula mirabilis TaxID=1507867 RepID=A0AAV9JTA1_9PEZI|nr:hypothetical protein LTR36_008528 [Oleoguttula mirabilis]
MPSLQFVTLDVFTTERFKGNPLGLVKVPKGHDVSTEQMQTIATEFNLSETVFLHEGVAGDDGVMEWRVRIFLTKGEVPFAGHPTIGTACYALGTLANNASKGRLLCKAGPIQVDYNNGRAKASIPHHIHIHTQVPFSEKQVYELQPALEQAGWAPKAIDLVSPVKGMNFICVELPSLEALAAIQMSRKPTAQLDEGWHVGFVGTYFYVICRQNHQEMDLQTRMIEGTFEDPATGSAACGLGARLALKHKWTRAVFNITQGVEMGRKSDITVDVTLKAGSDEVEEIVLGGSSVKVMEGEIHY